MHFTYEALWVIGILALAGAMLWALWRNRTRNRANDKVTEKATHELYADPDHYPQKREALKKDIRPS